VALFSRADRTFNLELAREGTTLIERLHVGDTTTKRTEHATEHAALAAYRRRFREILDEQWHLTLGDDDMARPVACDPAAEAAISAAAISDQDDHLSVYADWLIEQGDPCGELASLRARDQRVHEPELTVAIKELETTRADEIFGLYAGLYDQSQIRFDWSRGWVTTIDVGAASQPPYRHHPESSLGTLVSLALLAPIARFVRRLNFLRIHTSDVRSAIATSPRRHSIRQLGLTSRQHAQELLDVLPKLDELVMPTGAVVRGHPAVTSIALHQSGPDLPPGLLEGEWPALHTLSITSTRDISALLATLAESPFMATLRVLALTGPLETPIVRVIREAFPRLEIRT
jgi:hypothetical protein